MEARYFIKMKIAIVTAFYSPAICGVKQVVEELAERLVKDGHEVHVYCSDSDKEKRLEEKEIVINGVKVHRCKYWFRVSRFAYVWPSVYSKLMKEDFDIIHTHVFGHAHTFFGALVAKKKKIAHVHTTHCPWTEGHRSLLARMFLFVSYRTIGKLSFKWSDKIIAITPWEIEYIKKWGGKDDQIIVIPNGMDEILYKKVENNNFKKKYGIKGKVILFLGRLNVTKGPDKLVLAFKEILKERKDVSLVFVGPDEGMLQKVKELSKDMENVHILGAIRGKPNLAEAYQAADVYALPSYREGLPLTLFEAMASGLPIVASPVNGVSYEMKDNENGFFVQYGDVENLKKRILEILNDEKLSKKFSENNKRRAKDYSWDKIYKKTLDVYEKAIGKHKSKASST